MNVLEPPTDFWVGPYNYWLFELYRREIAEETGLKVGAPDASTRPVHVREGSILWRVHPFLFRLDSAEPVLNDENEAFEWVSPEDIQSRETVVDTFLVVDRMLNNQ